MKTSTIEDRFQDYLEQPSVETLLAVRELVLGHPDYDPYAPFWSRLARRFEDKRFDEVLAICRRHRTVCCLSPRFHFFWGVSAAESGEPAVAEDAKASMHSLLNTLIELGDGTLERPYWCTYLWDAYDVLQALGVQAKGQQLISKDTRRFDVLLTDTGQEFWFDVTDLTAGRGDNVAHRPSTSLAR